MSLYGSLFSGVSGLAATSTAMGIISDNISNVNTQGYKATTARFWCHDARFGVIGDGGRDGKYLYPGRRAHQARRFGRSTGLLV